MYQGFYTIASGVLMQERAIDVLSNNMVNAHTPGYKASRVVGTTFEKELLRVENGRNTVIGKSVPISVISEAPTRFDGDSLVQTDRPFDIAINGEGFFRIRAVQTDIADDEDATDADAADEALLADGGIYLTRNGNFDIDEEGYLVLRGVGRVQGREGDIFIGGSGFTVQPNGAVYSGELYLDTIDLVVPGEGETLERTGNSLFRFAEGSEGVPAEQAELVQNWLERPNIDFNREYTMVIEAQRTFQSCSTALQIVDKINQQAAAQIAAL